MNLVKIISCDDILILMVVGNKFVNNVFVKKIFVKGVYDEYLIY